jgi:hypothetical protein
MKNGTNEHNELCLWKKWCENVHTTESDLQIQYNSY